MYLYFEILGGFNEYSRIKTHTHTLIHMKAPLNYLIEDRETYLSIYHPCQPSPYLPIQLLIQSLRLFSTQKEKKRKEKKEKTSKVDESERILQVYVPDGSITKPRFNMIRIDRMNRNGGTVTVHHYP